MRTDDGSVTVEFALVLPAVVVVLVAGVSAVGVAVDAVRLADAAGVVARAEARGAEGSGSSLAARLAPGASVAVERGDLVCVQLERAASLGPLADLVPLTARSCAPGGGR